MTFRKLDLFPSSGEGGEKKPNQLGTLEKANLNQSINQIKHLLNNIAQCTLVAWANKR
jgi:hypothetical protein